jgi:drug/metabolite transporter (DMT)-like permease
MLFLGFFQISLPYALVFWGEQYITSGLAAVLFATLPFFVVIFAHFLVKEETLTALKAAGVVASFAGLVVIFWRDIFGSQGFGIQNSLYGSLAVVGSAASGGLGNVVGKMHAEKIDPAANVLVQALVGTLVLSSFGAATENSSALHFTPTAMAAVVYLGVVGSALAFVGLYWLLTKTTATNSSMLAFITPILALILGWAVLQEVPDPNLGLGTALILVGVYLTVKPPNRLF